MQQILLVQVFARYLIATILTVTGVASSSLDSHIRLWNTSDGSLNRDIDCGPGEVWNVAFSPDARFIASGSQSGNVNVWETESGTKQMVLEAKGKFALSVAYVRFPSDCYVVTHSFAEQWTAVGQWRA